MISETAVIVASVGKFFLDKKRSILRQKVTMRIGVSKNLHAIKDVLIAINNVRMIKRSINWDAYKVLTKIKQATSFSTYILFPYSKCEAKLRLYNIAWYAVFC